MSEHISVPSEFQDAVEAASKNKDLALLGVLAHEARAERWGLAGQQLVERTRDTLGALPASSKPRKVIVSTGHRFDEPDRPSPRFPLEMESAAREAIRQAVQAELADAPGAVTGLASLASGNDILFHEIAAELGLKTEAILALPAKKFVDRSVDQADSGLAERFRSLRMRLQPKVMTDPEPTWVSDVDEHYVFQRCNMWLLERAFAKDNAEVTVIALWNGSPGDSAGGTADMIALARERGARVVVLDTNQIFGF